MKKEENVFVPAIKLFVICLAVALGLSVLNYVTEPIIEKANEEKRQLAMKQVLENCSFEMISENVYEGICEGNTAGYAVSVVSPIGYGGDIELIVGFDTELNITGVNFVSMSETKDIGTKTRDNPEFIGQFVGKPVLSENEYKAVTGATVSSKAVHYGLELAEERVKEAIAK